MTQSEKQTRKPVLLLLRGSSGAGKSTWIQTHTPTALVCSADHYMNDPKTGAYDFKPQKLGYAHKSCLQKCSQAMLDGEPLIVIDNTNIVRKWYSGYVRLAEKMGYEVFQKCLTSQFQNVHGVPEDKVAQMRQNFETDTELPEWPGVI